MKFTKILILFLGITFIFSCKSKEKLVEPQVEEMSEKPSNKDREARRAERLAKIYEDLGLSTAQIKKMEIIQRETREKMSALRESYGDDRTGMREEMKTIREEQRKKIKGVLTAVQFQKYEGIMSEQRGRRGGGPGGRGGRRQLTPNGNG